MEVDIQEAAAAALLGAIAQEGWTVLVVDGEGMQALAPLAQVGALRQQGITVTVGLDEAREPLPGVSVSYLVGPGSLDRVGEDLERGLYDEASVAVLGGLTEGAVRALAARVRRAGAVRSIRDVGCRCVALGPALLTCVGGAPSLGRYPEGGAPPLAAHTLLGARGDAAIEAHLDACVDALLALVKLIGAVPVLHCSAAPGAPSAALAERFMTRWKAVTALADSAWARLARARTARRPALLLFDRSEDVWPLLEHRWSYAGLLHDELGLSGNTTHAETRVDLDAADAFWRAEADAEFPDIADAVRNALQGYHARRRALDDAAQWGAVQELAQVKRSLDAHTTLAKALLEAVVRRDLSELVRLETELVRGGAPEAALNYIDKVVGGELNEVARLDALRLAACIALHSDASGARKTRLENALDKLKCEAKLRGWLLKQAGGRAARPSLWHRSARLLQSVAGGAQPECALSRAALALATAAPEARALRAHDPLGAAPSPAPAHTVCCFVLGGGAYGETQRLRTLQAELSKTAPHTFLYATDDLPRAVDLLNNWIQE